VKQVIFQVEAEEEIILHHQVEQAESVVAEMDQEVQAHQDKLQMLILVEVEEDRVEPQEHLQMKELVEQVVQE
jgi:hypothetical protein